MSTDTDLRVRFAPSPTGALHIGGARTALYNWLAARHSGGKLVLRVEDTDLGRSTEENVAQIIDALEWLELDWDEGPLSQVARAPEHAIALEKLLESEAAYRDAATADDVKAYKAEHGNDRGYRGEPSADGTGAVRLRVPDEGDTVVEDLVHGEVRFPNSSYDDFVIARGDGSVLYNFAVAVDDADMGITEVIRGDDHLSNTPKQLLVLKALGHKPPRYAHVPLLHGPDGKKLSKRHGAASVQELRDAGYLPAAIRNYVALLGWGPGDDETLLDTDELVKRFRPEDVGKSSAVFDGKKLRWMNGRYMRELPVEDLQLRLEERHARPIPREAVAVAQEKMQTLADFWP
ncbi:MAG: glutamate--tRNA ligase, partial [Solirubrobacterales bacterium]